MFRYGLLPIFGMVLALYLALSFFAFPMTDDFSYCREEIPVLSGVWNHYFSWGGRYSAIFFLYLFPKVFDLVRDYWVVPFCHILGLTGAAILFLRSLGVKGRPALLFGLGFIAIYLTQLETVMQSFYWFAGTICYQGGLAFTLLALSCVFWPVKTRLQHSIACVGVAILGLVACGFSEVTNVLTLGPLVAVAVMQIWLGKKTSVRLWIAIAIWCLGCAIVVCAPGNYERMKHFSNYMDISWVLTSYTIYCLDRFFHWTLSLPTIAAAFLILTNLPRIRQHHQWLNHLTRMQVLFCSLVWLGITIVGALPNYLLAESEPMPRVGNVILFIHLAAMACMLILVASWLQNRGVDWSALGKKTALIAGIALSIGLLLGPNSRIPGVAKDLVTLAPAYRREQVARYGMAREAKRLGKNSVSLPRLKSKPLSLHMLDLDYGSSFSSYVGLDSVTVVRD